MTYYLKYRPQTLDDLDLESVRDSLKKIVSSGRIPHAFLFSGPKGTGKTSAARILAKIVNCESKKTPCNKCDQCKSITRGTNIDVIEIDAASHRGIDDVRSLRDAVKLAPASAKKKVYIIDEAQMLTVEASNALLKTLEEPPEHVLFILATTNPEKLIATIRSRTTEIYFPKPSLKEIVGSVAKVARGEKIKISQESLGLIAQAADNSFRDGQKILEQIILEKRSLDPASIEIYLKKIKKRGIDNFVDLLTKKDAKGAIDQVEKIALQGTAMEDFVEEILRRLRLGLLAKVGIGDEDLPGLEKEDLIYLIELFTKAAGEIKLSPIEQLPIELAIVKWGENEVKSETDKILENTQPLRPPVIRSIPNKSVAITDDIWRSILAQVKPINTSIEALLRAARPMGFDGRVLTLGVYYRFHKERLEEGAHRRVLEDVVAGVLGNPVRIVCTLTEPPAKKIVEEVPLTEGEDKDIIKIAEEIFGNV